MNFPAIFLMLSRSKQRSTNCKSCRHYTCLQARSLLLCATLFLFSFYAWACSSINLLFREL